MDFSGAIVNGLLTIIGYVAIFIGVYKVFQIATDIREIRDLLAIPHMAPVAATPMASRLDAATARAATRDLIAEDSAAAYAEHLLRAVNASSRTPENETQIR